MVINPNIHIDFDAIRHKRLKSPPHESDNITPHWWVEHWSPSWSVDVLMWGLIFGDESLQKEIARHGNLCLHQGIDHDQYQILLDSILARDLVDDQTIKEIYKYIDKWEKKTRWKSKSLSKRRQSGVRSHFEHVLLLPVIAEETVYLAIQRLKDMRAKLEKEANGEKP